MIRTLVGSIALPLAFSLAPVPQVPQTAPQSTESFSLTKVDVVGAKRYSAAEVVQVSGLKVGQTVAVPDLVNAARRLASTGLFKNVRYRYSTSQGTMILTFEMEDEAWTTPVVFDNFVWFTDDELTALVQKGIPQFNRLVPANAGSSGFLARELQTILEARQLPGRVEFTQAMGQFLFSVNGAGAVLRVCSVKFDGAQAVPDTVLQDAARELMNADYSQSFTTKFANGTMTQLYRRRGFWKAVVSPPRAAPDKGGGCGGVTVTLPVSEGPAYLFDRAEWTGNTAVPVKELDTALGMKAGDVADVTKLQAGLRVVSGAYGKQGYVEQLTTFTPRLDDAARKVVFDMTVKEGLQFFMGTLEILGLAAADEENLRKKWRLETGAVYDATYLAKFLDENNGNRRMVNSGLKVDAATRQVTVRIEYR